MLQRITESGGSNPGRGATPWMVMLLVLLRFVGGVRDGAWWFRQWSERRHHRRRCGVSMMKVGVCPPSFRFSLPVKKKMN
ncbi:hypothetical protein U1Q18_037930 [Sarracenia purpurea var. burkii]